MKKDNVKCYQVTIFLHSKKHVIEHLISQYSLPPMAVEDEIKVNIFGNTINIVLEAKED